MRIKPVLSLALSIMVIMGLLVSCGDGGDEQTNPPISTMEAEDLFSVIPLETSDFISLIPLGNLNPSGHVFPTGHHYFVLTYPGVSVPVKSPGEITVERISQMEHLTDEFIDYSITIRLTETITAKFGHLSTLAPFLLNEAGQIPLGNTYTTGGKKYRYSSKTVSIEVSAGTVIGTTGENPNMLALDFGVYDEEATPAFANPTRIESMGDYYRAVNGLNYFTGTTKAVLEGFCGNWDGLLKRTEAPLGGTHVQDIPGTAQGIWFREGKSNHPQDPHIALVHDNVDPSIPVFSIGNSIPGLNSGTYAFPLQNSGVINRDFGDITPDGQIYTFHSFLNGQNGQFLIQLLDESTLKMEKREPGTGLPTEFTQNAVIFVR